MSGFETYEPFSPQVIRDGTIARLKASAIGFRDVFRQRTIPTKDSHLPYAALWTVRDQTAPQGDPNCGSPSFLHNFTMAIDIAVAGKNDDELDAKLTAMAEGLRETLLTDASWVQLFEGIERCNIHYSYPKESDLILGMATIEIEVTFRSDWPPVEANDFTQVAVAMNGAGAPPPQRFDGYVTQFSVPGPSS